MPDDDATTCGHPTDGGDGPPCKHPTTDDGDADRCWIDAHNDAPTTSGDPGRDFVLGEDDHEDILAAARDGFSKAGCARAVGVDEKVLRRYVDAHDDFRRAFMRARHKGERRLVGGPLVDDDDPSTPDIDGQHARFLLSTSFDYVKTEKTELEHSGEVDTGSLFELPDAVTDEWEQHGDE